VVIPLAVLAPLLTQPLLSDHRLNIYGLGSAYLNRPWRLPAEVIDTVPYFLSVGNFRPLGRIYEWSLDVVVFGLVDLFRIPANIGLRLVATAAAILLTAAAVMLAECVTTRGRPFAAAPPVPVALLPFAIGAGFVAAGPMSTTVVFSGLYFFSSALVLATAAWACRAAGAARLGFRSGLIAVLVGAGLAAFNEMACLAVPLATMAVLLRGRVVFGRPWRALPRDAGIRLTALLWAGFLPVLLPVRAVIQANCADGGCYAGSEMALPGAAAALPNRLVSWLPPMMWPWAVEGREAWLTGAMPVLALAVLLVPAWRFVRAAPRLSAVDRRQALTLAGVAVAVLFLAGAMGSLNIWMQKHAALGHYGVGWRDSALTTVAGGTLVLALVGALPGRGRLAGTAGLPVLVAMAAVSAAANQAYHESNAAGRLPYLHNRIAQEMADFDPTANGNARRCRLRAQYLSTTAAANQPRIDWILDAAAKQVAGHRFCTQAPLQTVPRYLPILSE
jgi:hypothetical protein